METLSHSTQSVSRDELQAANESNSERTAREHYFGVGGYGAYPATIEGLRRMERTWSDEIARMFGEIMLALATHQRCYMMGDPNSQLKNIEQLTYWRDALIYQGAKACRMREVLEHNAFNAFNLDTMD